MEYEQRTTTTNENFVQKFENLNLSKSTTETKQREVFGIKLESKDSLRNVLQDLSNNKEGKEAPVTPEMKRQQRKSLRESPKVISPGIDKKDEHDAQEVTEYIKPILEHLRQTEVI